jgi:hypothetical protein
VFLSSDNTYIYKDGTRISAFTGQQQPKQIDEMDSRSSIYSMSSQGRFIQSSLSLGNTNVFAAVMPVNNTLQSSRTLEYKDFATNKSSAITSSSNRFIPTSKIGSTFAADVENMEAKSKSAEVYIGNLRAYKSVGVAIIRWTDFDIDSHQLKGELAGLECVLSSIYMFHVVRINIPSATETSRPGRYLRKELEKLYNNLITSAKPSLAILIYAGHGAPDRDRNLIWSGRSCSA